MAAQKLFFRRIKGRTWLALVLALLVGVIALVSGGAAWGANPKGARLERMRASAQYQEGVFNNEEPMFTRPWSSFGRMLFSEGVQEPEQAIQVAKPRFSGRAPASGVKITWLGHSTLLLQVDGKNYLTDPVWGERTSPFSWIGPRRWYPSPLSLDDLPPLDGVLISHDHYDHLDYPTIVQLKERDVRFVMPLGVGAHLERWGVDPARITELDWWQEIQIGDHTLVSVPARHASGRSPFDQNSTLWCGYVVRGPRHRLYFSGDTGFFPGLRDIGRKYGPFDVTMIEVGAYDRAWPDWHMGPEQAVLAHRIVGGRLFLPIHWGLFDLANHAWAEPMQRVMTASQRWSVEVASPRPGETIDGLSPPAPRAWWPEVPFRDANEEPILATKSGDPDERFTLEELRVWAPSAQPAPLPNAR